MSILYRWYRSARVYLQGYEINFQSSTSHICLTCNRTANEASTDTYHYGREDGDDANDPDFQSRSASIATAATSNYCCDDEKRLIFINCDECPHTFHEEDPQAETVATSSGLQPDGRKGQSPSRRRSDNRFCSNRISTAKYTFLSFLPLFLFEQFRRWANVFFLIIALLQQIKDVSPTGRYTTLVPLIFILIVSALKEAIEDFKRHRADGETNKRKVEVLIKSCWTTIEWADVRVGDIVRIVNNSFFPADLLLLASSEPKSISFIETANLDGETNLKIRQSLPCTAHLTEIAKLNSFSATIECQAPNRHLYEFNGILREVGQIFQPLTHDQILLRGAVLRNTNWVFGVVIYTGHDTKLMRNSTKAPLKRSTVDKVTNHQILMLFSILLVMCLISTVFNRLWTNQHTSTDWYLDLKEVDWYESFFNMLTFMILFNNLIPISLQVTLEIVRFVQAIFINMDIEMYDPDSDTPALARTSNLNEELGMVKYVFSDKTGTLTRNIMELKKCVVGSELFVADKNEHFSKSELVRKILNKSTPPKEKQLLKEFLTLLTICNTVIPESTGTEINYHAASPDERALVNGAKTFGYKFLSRTPDVVEIDALGTIETYEILSVLEFTSNRKRMSVIAKDAHNNIKLYCKGADTVIYERLSARGHKYGDVIIKYLEQFGVQGLRTLCCATAKIEPEVYRAWHKKFRNALKSIVNRDQELETVADLIETNLHLLGATAIEDKLQEGVPETIETLLSADIHVWVLTGDKQETAINIGYSCRLLSSKMPLLIINETCLDDTRDTIQRYSSELGDNLGSDNEMALIVDGRSLKYALSHSVQSDFIQLCISCKSVICCRVSPIQKADVVELVSKFTKSVTLAIGDGANDIAMIQKAHVGIGISGQEGLQAVSASDYSIAQFRFLKRLLFVHGAWNYTRMSKLILYSFYKNICLYVIELWFAIDSGWSGQVLFERWSIGLYNVVFTALPPLAIGIFDKVSTAEIMLKFPQLYKGSQNEKLFNTKVFWIWIINALAHSVLLYWITLYICRFDVLWKDGLQGGFLVTGNFVYTVVVVTVSLKAGLITNIWTYMTHSAIILSILLWFLFIFVYSFAWPTFNIGAIMAGMYSMIFTTPVFWLSFIIVPVTVLIPDLLVFVLINELNYPLFEIENSNKVEAIDCENNTRPESATTSTLPETTKLLRSGFLKNVKKVFVRKNQLQSDIDLELSHGYAFSQEEGATVSQSDIIRAYNTNLPKPDGF